MARHLASCRGRQTLIASADQTAHKPEVLHHLRMQDAYGGAYWFDAEVRGSATLESIDDYLRAIWLECCGHLSKFSIDGWRGKEIPSSGRVDTVFQDRAELTHIYDFGTESVTLIKQLDHRHASPLSARPIVLMARNVPPEAPCVDCGEPASYLCKECQIEWESPGTLCCAHAESHPHDDYGEPIEIVNSPRLGLCGYGGPAEPPY